MGRFVGGRRWWWRLLAAVAVTATALAGFAAREWPAWQARRAARRALAAGRYEDAWASVGRWLDARPGSAEAHYYRAKTAIALGKSRGIVDGLRQAEAGGYPASELDVLRALLDAQQGRPAKAQPVLDRAFAQADGPDPMLDEALARVYLALYDFPRASAVLVRWAEDAPHDPRPPLWHAHVLLRRGANPEDVLADLREALRRDPGLAEARLELANELARAHHNEAAAAEFSAYLAAAPDDPAALLGSGRNAMELGDLAAAARALDHALALDPDNAEAHAEHARVDLRRRDPAAALAHLDRAVELKPFDPELRYSRTLVLSQLGRRDEAAREQRRIDQLKDEIDRVNDLQARLARSPADAALQNEIARWMFAHGYDREGVSWSRKILADNPGHPETRALLADYYERVGDPATAARYRTP